MAAKAKVAKKPAVVKAGASSILVAKALRKHFPNEAEEIVKVMSAAATNKSMLRKLARLSAALKKESAQ